MDRLEFSNRLLSTIIPEGTPPEDIPAMTRPVSEAICLMMPDSLFRFRTCSPDAVDAFEKSVIYAVTADRFNDPYDTLVRYDLEEIEKGVNVAMSVETLAQLKSWLAQGNDFPDIIKQFIPEEMMASYKKNLMMVDDFNTMEGYLQEIKHKLISSIETLFPVLSEASKKYSTVACFSESIKSILMWSHYADSHKGFALEYNFRPTLEQPITNVMIAPVLYQDVRLDISSYIVWAFLLISGVRIKSPDISAYIKNALFKSSDWSYEKEWRLIDLTPRDFFDTSASAIPYKPEAIYYGRNMTLENKRMLHEIAQKVGVREYEMYIDYSSPKYEMGWTDYSG